VIGFDFIALGDRVVTVRISVMPRCIFAAVGDSIPTRRRRMVARMMNSWK
jgi:hypothetical protein